MVMSLLKVFVLFLMGRMRGRRMVCADGCYMFVCADRCDSLWCYGCCCGEVTTMIMVDKKEVRLGEGGGVAVVKKVRRRWKIVVR